MVLDGMICSTVSGQVVAEVKREDAAWRLSRKEKEGQRLTDFFAACLLSEHLSGIREYSFISV